MKKAEQREREKAIKALWIEEKRMRKKERDKDKR